MIQTAEKPTQITFDKLTRKFEEHFPHLLEPLERAKPKLDRGEGAGDLANIISCEVKVEERATSYVYTWAGQSGGKFECHILKPFSPHSQRQPPAPEAAFGTLELQPVSDDVRAAPDEASAIPQRADEVQEVELDTLEEKPAPTPELETTTHTLLPGIFSALAELTGENTLLMTLTKYEDELTVNVMPFGDDKDASVSAVCLTGTPRELDEGFVEAIRVKVETKTSLAEQIEALKAADKALLDAKKAEADAKKAEATKKTKATEDKKKEEEKKKQENVAKKQQEAEAAEGAGKQERVF